MRGVSRRSARSRTKKPDAVTSEMHRCISPDKQQRPGWKETLFATVTFDRCCSGAMIRPTVPAKPARGPSPGQAGLRSFARTEIPRL